MMIKQKIIDHHGRVENIQLYDKDPTVFKKEAEALAKAQEKESKKKPAEGEEEEEVEA